MARVKILLEPGETQLDVDVALEKALNLHSSGDIHEESFTDPAMIDLSHRLESAHSKMYVEMIRAINDLLDKEFSSGGE